MPLILVFAWSGEAKSSLNRFSQYFKHYLALSFQYYIFYSISSLRCSPIIWFVAHRFLTHCAAAILNFCFVIIDHTILLLVSYRLSGVFCAIAGLPSRPRCSFATTRRSARRTTYCSTRTSSILLYRISWTSSNRCRTASSPNVSIRS